MLSPAIGSHCRAGSLTSYYLSKPVGCKPMELRRPQLYKFPFISDCVSPIHIYPHLALEHEGLPRLCPPTFLFTSALLQPPGPGAGPHLVPLLIPILLTSVAKRSLPRRCFSPTSTWPGPQDHPPGASRGSRSALRQAPRWPELFLVSTAYRACCLRPGADPENTG